MAAAECPICLNPLGDGRTWFNCRVCRHNRIHLSCAKSIVKADRLRRNGPIQCPFCRSSYAKEELQLLLPTRRNLIFQYHAQPLDENSIYEIKVTEHYDRRVEVPEDPFAREPDIQRSPRESLTCFFEGQQPVAATAEQPVVVAEQEQRQQPAEVPRGPENSPVRNVVRNHLSAERALEHLAEAVRQLRPHRMRTRSMVNGGRRQRTAADRLNARISCIRRLFYGLNTDLLDYLLAA